MKTKLSTITLAATAAIAMIFASCGAKKVDTLDSLADEVIVEANRIAEAMTKVKDKESAKAAADVISKAGVEAVAISKRLEKLEIPSDAEKKRLQKKIEDATAAGEESIGKLDPAVMGDPEIQKIMTDLFVGFDKNQEEADKVFNKYFKVAGLEPIEDSIEESIETPSVAPIETPSVAPIETPSATPSGDTSSDTNEEAREETQ